MSRRRGRDRVVLLHGWPGLPSDFDGIRELLRDVIVDAPALDGFGEAFRGLPSLTAATADAHAGRVIARLDEGATGGRTIIAGYDIGSRIAQAALRAAPQKFDGAVLTPGYPGIGSRAALPEFASTFWYQHFHRKQLSVDLIDGRPDAVEVYLDYIWREWSGPSARGSRPRRDEVLAAYSRPGAFAASIQWYRANRGYAADVAPIETPVTMLWPTKDPLFPVEWADRLSDHFLNATLQPISGSGHFLPIEKPTAFAAAIISHLEAYSRD